MAGKVAIIPISLKDDLAGIPKGKTSRPPVCLIIGDNWYPNLHGLKWFLENVLEHTDIRLQIVGRNLGNFSVLFSHPKIEYLGFIEDLSDTIINADLFLCPIFKGGGMKVKVCEALMYGKTILGTSEAFEGYDVTSGGAGILCNTKEDFIRVLEFWSITEQEKFNKISRGIYLEKYSFIATLNSFRKLLDLKIVD
jgi:hypothetical protein